MPRAGERLFTSLWIALVQVVGLCTEPTAIAVQLARPKNLYYVLCVAFTRLFLGSTHLKITQNNLLGIELSPLSTRPITNTKLINKDLYS